MDHTIATPAPMSDAEQAPEPVPQKTNGHVKFNSPVNILLVDDRTDKLLAIEAILEPLEQNIVKARSGKEALRHLLHQDFAVILLDVAMPGMDGFETATMIRKRERTEHTPIIFVTSISNSENNVFLGYSLGAVDYIMTPIVPEVLRTKVSVFVELHKKTELIKQQAEQLRRAEETKYKRELAEATDRLEAETKRNRFFTLALDLLGIADFNGYLLQVNPAWEKVLGYPEAELKSRSGLDFVHPDDRDAMAQQLEQIQHQHLPSCFEGRYQHKSGSYRWLSWTAVPFTEEKLIYIFARDITERKAAEDEIKLLNGELNRRINDLTEINKELESFNYSISHDLRAPLRSIASFTQVVRSQYDGMLKGDGHDYLRRVENAAKYMDKLLMDLLDYSRLSRSEMDEGSVDLESAVSDVLFSIEQEVRTRDAEVAVQRPLGSVVGHSATVRQILLNLLVNGLKFVRAEQRPQIRIWSEQRDGFLRVWVEDHGIGIAPQFHKKIFGLFQRLHSHSSFPGTGVGLAMVQKGVERMGGRIGVDSELGQGSRFWFELRAADNAETPTDSTADLQKTVSH
jgi:PAS domain S-box-containing protein